MFGMGKDIILKSVVALAKGYFDKNPAETLTISVNEISHYIRDNYKDFNVVVETDQKDTKLFLSKKKWLAK